MRFVSAQADETHSSTSRIGESVTNRTPCECLGPQCLNEKRVGRRRRIADANLICVVCVHGEVELNAFIEASVENSLLKAAE
jgi:hypothetical protein